MVARTMLGVLVVAALSSSVYGQYQIDSPVVKVDSYDSLTAGQAHIRGSNAVQGQISPTRPIHGGNGGTIEIFSGVVADVGDGSLGDLTHTKELWPGEYSYRSIASNTSDGSSKDLIITVRGNVIIHCQQRFEAVVRADYSFGPPKLVVYAGDPGNLFGIISLNHMVYLDMSPNDSHEPIDGGSFVFHTSAVGEIYTDRLCVDGGIGLNGGNGGDAGSITLHANDGPIWADCYARGGRGGNALEPGRDGGCGGDGGSVSVTSVCKQNEPDDCRVDIKCLAGGGYGGAGADADTTEMTPTGTPGGNGGHGGHGGSLVIEADTIQAGVGSPYVFALNGGAGGSAGTGGAGSTGARGSDGGAGGRGGQIWIEGTSIGLRDISICGGFGGFGSAGGDAGEPGGDGGMGGNGGDGGAAGQMYCGAEDLEITWGGSSAPDLTWLAYGGGGGHPGPGGTGGAGAISMLNASLGGNGGPGGKAGDGGPGGHWDVIYTNITATFTDGFRVSSSGGNGGEHYGCGGDGGGGSTGGAGGRGGNGGTGGLAGSLPVFSISKVGFSTDGEDGRHGDGGWGGAGGDSVSYGGSGMGGDGGNGGDGYRGGRGGNGGSGGYGGNGGSGGNGGNGWSNDGCSDPLPGYQGDNPYPGMGGNAGTGANDGAPGKPGRCESHDYNDGSKYQRPPRNPYPEGNRWTIMYYSAADQGNIENSEIVDRLDQLEDWDLRGAPVKIIVQMDRFQGGYSGLVPEDDTKEGDWDDTRLGVVEYDGKKGISTLFAPIGETNTGDKNTLADFIKDCKNLYPAKHYMLIISGHGNPINKMAPDSNPGDFISPKELREAIMEAETDIDILFANVCMGASLEWIAELAATQRVKYYLACELFGNSGYNLDRTFAYAFVTNPYVAEEEPLRVAWEALMSWPPSGIGDLRDQANGRFYSLIDVQLYDRVVKATREFVEAARALDMDGWRRLRSVAISLSYLEQTRYVPTGIIALFPQQKDMILFAKAVEQEYASAAEASPAGKLASRATALENAVNRMLLDTRSNQCGGTKNCRGISVHLLSSTFFRPRVSVDYSPDLRFCKDTGWYQFLADLNRGDSSATGSHQMYTADVSDSLELSEAIDLAGVENAVITSYLEGPDDVDWFSVDVESGQAVYLRLLTYEMQGSGATLSLYGPNDQTLIARDSTQAGKDGSIHVVVSESATYFVSVGCEDGVSASSGGETDESAAYGLEVVVADPEMLRPRLAVADDPIDFGATQINSTPEFQSVAITNSGLLPVEITDVTMADGEFFKAVLDFPLPMRIEPNRVGELVVEFCPTNLGQYTGTMTLATNDPEQPFVELTLAGLGIDEPDGLAPESSAGAWTAEPSDPSIVVTWSGWDGIGGSGIASYDVYVSVDGGQYTLWQFRTNETSAIYSGERGHTYAFYSIATDKAGNVEPGPIEPDIQVIVSELPAGAG